MKKFIKVLDIFIIILFSIYVLLDSFVIPQAYQKVDNSLYANEELSLYSTNEKELEESVEYINTENEYQDENIHITINTYRYLDTDIYVADIELSSIDYLSSAFAHDTYGKNITDTTSSIAESSNAILAINGDYYGAKETGYVLRNGTIYRTTSRGYQEDLAIDANGDFYFINEEETDLLMVDDALQVYSFGPALIDNYEIVVTEADEVGKAKASNPRTAICQVDTLHYLFVVSDGRTSSNAGLSLKELANFLESLGVKKAYNLDGGGSSTMYFNGEVINNPTTNGKSIKERSVSDAIIIKG